jgi:hypothetical protein
MNLEQQALRQLERFYETCITNKRLTTSYDYRSWINLDNVFKEDILKVVNYMQAFGWIIYTTDNTRCPMNIKLTHLGIDIAEGNHIPNTNQEVVDTGTCEKLINEKISDVNEQQALISEIKMLKEILDSNKPIEKGSLSWLNSTIQKHPWLADPIALILFQYAVNNALK